MEEVEGMRRRRTAEIHVVMFPLMAQGHMIPFVELAKLLAKRRSSIITLVTTPANMVGMETMLESHSRYIRLEQLPFPSEGVEGFPPGVESTDSLPYDLVFGLIQACEQLENPFEQLLQRLTPCGATCIISDMFFGWTLDVANRLGIPRLTFNTAGAFATSLYYSLWSHLPHMTADSDTFSLPDLPHVSLHKSQLPLTLKLTHTSDPWYLFLKRQIPRNLNSWGTLVNTFDDLEPEFLDHLRANVSCGRVWSVGPVLRARDTLSQIPSRGHGQQPRGSRVSGGEELENWLDSQRPSSVLYIAFGTQVGISASQMKELAAGLEGSQQPFVWAMRPPNGIDCDSSDFLPEGFERRAEETKQGIVIRGWAPQLWILSHPSTGCFLSHCGWNSVLESLSQGVPIIGWPLAADQFYNSKLLTEEVGVSVELCRGVDGQLSKQTVESTVRMVMTQEKGIALRKRAWQMRKSATGAVQCSTESRGSSMSNVDNFLQQISESIVPRI